MTVNLFDSYFASANGFDGFRSSFKKIFNPEKYDKLFVLKGGPGTGKSTLMKAVKSHFKAADLRVESIFCSSDKSSLDGVIVENGEKRVAIIDGTAPHETDARIPGAIDEIINLSAFWSAEELMKNRKEIIKLNKIKRAHYDAAYELLRLGGEFFSAGIKAVSKAYDFGKADLDAFLISEGKKQGRNANYKILSCFGKDGYWRLEGSLASVKRKILVKGSYGSELIYLNEILAEALQKNISFTAFTSPLSDNITEAIYFHGTETLLDTRPGAEEIIDTSSFLDRTKLAEHKERLDLYTHTFNTLLEKSAFEFSEASKAHFKLEEIYKANMDFDKIQALTGDIICILEGILFP